MSIENQEAIVAKLHELNNLIRESGLRANINVNISDDQGWPEANISLSGGYWRNSTATCEPGYYRSAVDLDIIVDHDTGEIQDVESWQPSSANC